MIAERLGEARDIVIDAWRAWSDDGAMQWGAALAYYAVLSLPPLLLILLLLVGQVHGDAAARVELLRWSERLFGTQGLGVTRTILQNSPESAGIVGLGTGVFLVLVGTGLFAHLQRAMNEIWEVEWPGGGIVAFLRARLLGFLLVMVLGSVLTASVGASAAISVLAPYAERLLPAAPTLFLLLNFAFTCLLVTLLFASSFQVLPDVRIPWRAVWVGAVVSATLFLVGNGILSSYLRRSSIGSAYGAAGSLLGVLVWIYYSAQVYFFGAELTRAWVRRYGGRVEPARGAIRRRD